MFDDSTMVQGLYDSVHTSGDPDLWLNTIKYVRTERNLVFKISVAASLASVLVGPLSMLSFILNINGPTGIGKTVSLMIAASVWADPLHGTFIMESRSTPPAMELQLNALESLPLLVDDMSQIERQLADGGFDDYVYMLCSGRGKNRSTKNLSLRDRISWNNAIISNCEHPLRVNAGGAVNRVIDVDVPRPILSNPHGIIEVIGSNYGLCGKDFISALEIAGWDAVKDIQKNFLDQLRTESENLGINVTDKQLYPMSLILSADKISNDYIFGGGELLDLSECCRLLRTNDSVSKNSRAAEFIGSRIAENMDKIENSERYSSFWQTWGKLLDNDGVIAITAQSSTNWSDRAWQIPNHSDNGPSVKGSSYLDSKTVPGPHASTK